MTGEEASQPTRQVVSPEVPVTAECLIAAVSRQCHGNRLACQFGDGQNVGCRRIGHRLAHGRHKAREIFTHAGAHREHMVFRAVTLRNFGGETALIKIRVIAGHRKGADPSSRSSR